MYVKVVYSIGELSVAQLVGFLVVKPVHPDLSPRLDTGARIFLNFYQDLTALFFSGRRSACR